MSRSTRSSETMRNDQTADLSNEKHAFVSRHLNGSVFPYAIGANRERHSLFSSEVKKERKTLGLHFLKTLLILTVLMWACLSIFWGSTYKLLDYFSDLTINVYDFDSTGSSSAAVTPIVGPVFTSYASYSNSLPASMPHLGYRVIDVTQSPYSDLGTQGAIDDVLRKRCWGAIVIHSNATTAWRNAVQAGDAGYDPQGTVGIYYMGARYYQIVLLYLRPFLIRDVSTNIQTASQTALSSILTSLSNTYTAPSQYPPTQPPVTTTLAALETVPQAMSGPFGYYTYDLRPQTAWGAAAVFEAGDIYYLIFAFHLALWHYLGRTGSGLQKKLTYNSLLLLRIIVPVFVYFWMSLWYTCIIAAFHVPFNNTVGAAGFVVDWALNWVTLMALGFAFETMLSVLTAKFLPLFLIVWIILNITSSFQPLTVMGRFYNFFLIFPFYHHVEASKIIFFNTSPSSYLGVHFGALFGVIGVNWIFLALAVWLERKRDDKAAKQEQEKKQDEEKKQEEEQ